MKRLFRFGLGLVAAGVLLWAADAGAAAVVNGLGYTNDFSARPAAADWSTRSFGSSGTAGAGELTSIAALEAAVQTNSAALITNQVGSATGTPPAAAATAVWSSAGFYLQTRPSGNAATLLMVTLVNNTTTNATSIRIAYDYTTNRASSVAEQVRGLRAYYSLTGSANSWSNIVALSSTAEGRLSMDLPLAGMWAIGSNLFLLWADDNGSGTPDDPNDIDNFFVAVIGGMPLALSCDLTAPANGNSFPDTNSVTLAASASPGPDATLTGVAFYEVTGGLLGSALNAPYVLNASLSAGVYQVYAVASNSLGATIASVTNTITVTNVPLSVALLAPANGTVYPAPTNVVLSAAPYAGTNAAITGVGFYEITAGLVGSAVSAPYAITSAFWGGTYQFYAVATNSLNATAASITNTVVFNIPPSNTVAPTIFSQNPPHSTPLTNFTSITVTFSEPVTGVNAADLLVNGNPATNVTGSGTNYTFAFPQPVYGEVTISWAAGHGITDFGWPAPLPFDATGLTAQWGYYLFDQTPPTISARVPAASATATNAEQISVIFSEAVSGVHAADLLINGTPATSLSGSGSNYTFSLAPLIATGPLTVNVTWATNHGITDLATTPNAFNATNAGWSFTLDNRTLLVQSNSLWRFIKGQGEASNPTNAWRFLSFDDTGWSNAPAPFFYGDPYSNGVPAYTLLSDMQSNYSTIYLRQVFTVANRSAISNLYLAAQVDDGFVAWLNGTEVRRVNAPTGEVAYNAVATANATEPQNAGAAYVSYLLTNAASLLVDGPNVLAIHALNQSLTASSDFGFNAQLYTYVTDTSQGPPRVVQADPPEGEYFFFTNVTIIFNENVGGVNAADLLVNGVPASSVSSTNPSIYAFGFTQPAYGAVVVTWATDHGIADLDEPPKAFDHTAASATRRYSLVNPSAPTIATTVPAKGASVSNLSSVSVVFSEPVAGVDAADLLVNGTPAAGFTGSGASYLFSFPQPAYGTVNFSWATNTGIQDLDIPAAAFDGARASNVWSCVLVDRAPPAVAAQNPPAGSAVINLTQLTVTFTEPVTGIDASDLLINGRPASGVSGSGVAYTFSFAAPNVEMILVTWATNHGIRDLAATPNAFSGTASGDTWSYTTTDTVAPSASVYPLAGVTVRRLAQIAISFDEPVAGVNASDLLVNNIPAQQVSGTGAGPYSFTFNRAATGLVQVAFAAGHGIHDLATPSNLFGGAAWTYTVDATLPVEVAVSHVIQISLDGLAAVHLRNYVSNAPAQFPNFVRLTREAAFTFNARCDYDISETVPNHITMFTGRPVLQPNGQSNTVHHGYNNNFPAAADTIHNAGNLNVAYKMSMFDVAHDYGRTTAFYAGKTRLDICDRSFNGVNGALDLIGADNGRDKIDVASVLDISGASISNEVNSVVADLTSANPKQYTFIHIAEPDLTGHSSSWGSANWSNAVRMVDTQLGRILDTIDANPALAGQTALIVTADHGGGGVTANAHTEAYHINNYTVPFFLRAPGIVGGSDLYALFANRGEPGTNRTDYTTQPQPLRNGDGSNLALALLGLPPISGSFMVPAFASPTVTLHIVRYGNLMTVFWYDPQNEYALETADGLATPIQWRTITEDITVNETTKVYTITNTADFSPRFFRLKTP